MGDLATLLTGLNLSPVNTILLAGLVLAIKHIVGKFECRITALEEKLDAANENISWLEGRLNRDQPDE